MISLMQYVWLGVACWFVFWLFRALWRRIDGSGLPASLRGAPLAYAEQTFKSTRLRIAARLDRAYRRNGVLTLVELKTRDTERVYRSDIIELSAQRVALTEETGEPVEDVAFVLIQRPGSRRRRSRAVRLLPFAEVEWLAQRLRLLRQGEGCARPTLSKGLCGKCEFLAECSRTYGDR